MSSHEVSLKINHEHEENVELSHHSRSRSMSHKEEVNETREIEQNPTKKEDENKMLDMYNKFFEKFPNWDLYMIFELFVFVISFFFLVGESKDSDIRGEESDYLFQVNSVLLIDFLFRLLSIEIESIKRKYWNHVLHCILPLIMWLLAAFYKFDNVFGSDPIKVLNALLFTMLNLFIILVIIFKFFTLDNFKNLCKKKDPEPKPENDLV